MLGFMRLVCWWLYVYGLGYEDILIDVENMWEF